MLLYERQLSALSTAELTELLYQLSHCRYPAADDIADRMFHVSGTVYVVEKCPETVPHSISAWCVVCRRSGGDYTSKGDKRPAPAQAAKRAVSPQAAGANTMAWRSVRSRRSWAMCSRKRLRAYKLCKKDNRQAFTSAGRSCINQWPAFGTSTTGSNCGTAPGMAAISSRIPGMLRPTSRWPIRNSAGTATQPVEGGQEFPVPVQVPVVVQPTGKVTGGKGGRVGVQVRFREPAGQRGRVW